MKTTRTFFVLLGASFLVATLLSVVIKNAGATVGETILGLGCLAWGIKLGPPRQTMEKGEKVAVHPLDVTQDILLIAVGIFLLGFCLPWTLQTGQTVEAALSAVLGVACLICGALGISRWGREEQSTEEVDHE